MTEKVIKALRLCAEQKCDQCIYNRWVRDVCQKHLLRDAAKVIENKEGGYSYGND